MHRSIRLLAAAGAAAILASCAMQPKSPMGFFITSTNPGKGGDFGGLEGADRHCQALATAVGGGDHTWHAYLSTVAANGQPAVNARDRIGRGPWKNAKGVVVATGVDDLHGPGSKVGKENSLTEKGAVVNGAGDTPNMHDILTGSNADGTVATGANDTTCRNWTSSDQGSAILGHHDHRGTNPDPVKNASWNSSHGSRGCSPAALQATGSAGLLYCFAAD